MTNHTCMVLDLDVTQKRRVERAAARSGMSLSDFARETLPKPNHSCAA